MLFVGRHAILCLQRTHGAPARDVWRIPCLTFFRPRLSRFGCTCQANDGLSSIVASQLVLSDMGRSFKTQWRTTRRLRLASKAGRSLEASECCRSTQRVESTLKPNPKALGQSFVPAAQGSPAPGRASHSLSLQRHPTLQAFHGKIPPTVRHLSPSCTCTQKLKLTGYLHIACWLLQVVTFNTAISACEKGQFLDIGSRHVLESVWDRLRK